MKNKTNVFIAGGGRIGSLLALLLSKTGDYHVCLADTQKINLNGDLETTQIDITDKKTLTAFLKDFQPTAIFSCLPFYHNVQLAGICKEMSLHYFDLSEDRETRNAIKKLAHGQDTAFISACGTAPGVVNIIAHDLASKLDEIDSIKLRVGCLPLAGEKGLQYALTWSTEGLINQYANLCSAIVDGERTELLPLKNIESLTLDGTTYEAFNTSGGIGTLAETYAGKAKNLNYKTMRYPGHCEKMNFLMSDLRLAQNRDMLKEILESALPETKQDVTVIFVSVQGNKAGHLIQELYLKKFYPEYLFGEDRSSIQMTTASAACAIIDLVLTNPSKYHGAVLQEDFSLSDFYNNRFGKMFMETH